MSNVKFTHYLSTNLVEDLKILINDDTEWQNSPPIPDDKVAYKSLSTLFLKYILLANSFTKLINMIVTFHKRERLKPLLSILFGRIIELKAELSKMQKTELLYLDDVIIEMGLSRRDIEILIPDYYRYERSFVVKEFFRYTEKIREGLVLKTFPSKRLPELELNLTNYYLTADRLKVTYDKERLGREKMKELKQETSGKKLFPIKKPPLTPSPKIDGKMNQILEMMGRKRDKVYEAMRTIRNPPLTEPYESWRFPFARDVVKAPYFGGEKYFHGYDKLQDPFQYAEFIGAVQTIQKHERARIGGIRYSILKERNEKMMSILMNKRKGLKTELKSKKDYVYPIKFEIPLQIKMKPNANARLFGLLPRPSENNDFCRHFRRYKSEMRKTIENSYRKAVEIETRYENQTFKYDDVKELDIVDEILEYFRAWLQESKPMAVKLGWDLLDIPDPNKKALSPPVLVAGIPKMLTDDYVENNFDKLIVPQRPPHLSGTALIVSGNHITKEKYMEVKPLALARQLMTKEAREAEDKKKDTKKEDKDKKKDEKVGYRPAKSQIPVFALEKAHDLEMVNNYDESEIRPLILPKLVDEDELIWKRAIDGHLKTRDVVDRKMIAFQKEVRSKMTKKHRKAENLKKRLPVAAKKPKKEWFLNEEEKWNIIYALSKDGYFMNYRNKTMDEMAGKNIFSLSNFEWIEEYLTEPEPAWGDLYNLVKLWCILPLADLTVRQYGPVVSAVNLTGPREVINRLVCAIASTTGSVVVRINPNKPVGELVPMNQLAQMIVKIAKTSQPTVILIEDLHVMYKTKSPYLKVVRKIKKNVNRKFKILLIGTTDKPELIKSKQVAKDFDKVIPFPLKDYHSSADNWGNYLFGVDGLSENFPYPALVGPTKPYKSSQMTQLFADGVLSYRRTKDVLSNPLKISEFVEPLRIAKLTEKSPDNSLKIPMSPYLWAVGKYKAFKARKKMLKELLDARNEALNPDAKKNKK